MLSPNQPRPNHSILRAALLLFGILMGSSAVIMIKASTEQPFLVASYRLLIAALVLSPFFYRDLKNFEGSYGWKQIGWSTVPALALAIHFMTWVVGTRMTQVANASLIVNLTPVVMPFLVWGFFREKINRQEVFGTLFTLLVIPSIYVLIAKQHVGEEHRALDSDLDLVEVPRDGIPQAVAAAAK